jgi:hypothetical protein
LSRSNGECVESCVEDPNCGDECASGLKRSHNICYWPAREPPRCSYFIGGSFGVLDRCLVSETHVQIESVTGNIDVPFEELSDLGKRDGVCRRPIALLLRC